MTTRSIKFCCLLLLCSLVPGMSLMLRGSSTNTPNALSAPAGNVQDSEPNIAFGILDFCIAPQNPRYNRSPSPLTTQKLEQCGKDFAENGPSASIKREDEFVWIKIMKGVKLPPNLIIEEYEGTKYLLVYNWLPFVMSSETGWGLKNITKDTRDSMGRPAIGFQFDWRGADRFYYLTSANVGQNLAICIHGEVVSAPNIQTAIRSQAVITGDFTAKQIDDMINTLQKIVRPASTTAVPVVRREWSAFLIPVLIFVLAVLIICFLVYR